MMEHTLEKLLPHRKPMLLLDKIISVTENEILTQKFIEPDAFFLQGHYPNYPIVPGIITCECLFQSGAALLAVRLGTKAAGTEVQGKVPVVARIEKAKFRLPIRPGDLVTYKVSYRDEMTGVYFLKGEARVNDRIVATAEFACALTPNQL